MRQLLRLRSAPLIFALALLIAPSSGRILHAEGSDAWDGIARSIQVPVLMYHYVDKLPADADRYLRDLDVLPENFAAQMQWLRENDYHTITPDEMIAALWHGEPLPSKPIMITFDDGYANAYYNVFPILRANGFSGVFFVVTSWIDAGKPGYIGWAEAKAMSEGGMFIENHSVSHENMKNRSFFWLEKEIGDAQKTITEKVGVAPRLFCYPYGAYDGLVMMHLRSAGIAAAFTENLGYAEYASNMLRIPRIRVRGRTDLKAFAALVTNSAN